MIAVRNATEEDAAKIVSFQQAMALETENIFLGTGIVTPGVSRVFRDPSKGRYYVAADNDEVVASLLITYEWSDWRNADVWWFQSVYVLPEYRRKGLFRKMYDHVRSEALAAGAAGLRLYVESNNLPALKTYEAMGMNSQHYTMYEWMR